MEMDYESFFSLHIYQCYLFLGRHEQRLGLLAPEHEEQTKGMIPPKSSMVPQRVESRLLAEARRIYSWPHTGVGPVGLVQGLVRTLDAPSGRGL